MPSWGKRGRYGGFLRLWGAIFHRAPALLLCGVGWRGGIASPLSYGDTLAKRG
jgi:hypothetical protein